MEKKNANIIKEANLARVSHTLHYLKTATKPQLSKHTGISVVTINSLINTLLKNGEVYEQKTVTHAPYGRPAVSYTFNGEYSLALIIYMYEKKQHDTAFFTICNLYGEKMYILEKEFETIQLGSFDSVIEELLKKYPAVKIIGFGMPAEEMHGTLIICDYPHLQNTEFATYIEHTFHRPVFIENDVNAAALGYYHLHCVRQEQNNVQCVVTLYFPRKYPPGAGVCIGGTVVKGKNGLAGEIKYLPFSADSPACAFSEHRRHEFILKTIKTYLCVYNPDVIVLYTENDPIDYEQEISDGCLSDIEKQMLAPIVISNKMNTDFEAGILYLALEKIF